MEIRDAIKIDFPNLSGTCPNPAYLSGLHLFCQIQRENVTPPCSFLFNYIFPLFKMGRTPPPNLNGADFSGGGIKKK